MSYYEVYCDGVSIYDPAQAPLSFIEPKVVVALNEAGSFDFILPKDNVFYENIIPYGSTIEVFEDGKSVFYGRPTPPSTDFYGNKIFHCEGALAFLNDVILPPIPVANKSSIHMSDYLTILFDYYNNTVRRADRKLMLGEVSLYSDQQTTHEWSYNTCFEVLKREIMPYTGSYIVTRRNNQTNTTYIDIKYSFDNDVLNQPIKIASNLIDFEREGRDFYTAALAKGGKDSNKVQVQMLNPVTLGDEQIQKYGFMCAFLEYPHIDNLSDLEAKCKTYLQQQDLNGVSFSASAVDLHPLNPTYEQLLVGKSVNVQSNFHGFDSNARCVINKVTINLAKGEKECSLATLVSQVLTVNNNQYEYLPFDYEHGYDGLVFVPFDTIPSPSKNFDEEIWTRNKYDPSKLTKWTDDPGKIPPGTNKYFAFDARIKVVFDGEVFERYDPDNDPWDHGDVFVYYKDPNDPTVLIAYRRESKEDLPDIDELWVRKYKFPQDVVNGKKPVIAPLGSGGGGGGSMPSVPATKPNEPYTATDKMLWGLPVPKAPEPERTPIRGDDGNLYSPHVGENGDGYFIKIPESTEIKDGQGNPIDSLDISPGDVFNSDDYTIIGHYGDGTTEPLDGSFNYPDGYVFTGDETDLLGFTDVDGFDFTTGKKIIPDGMPDITEIYFSSTPSRVYWIGASFSFSGYAVAAKYSDGKTSDITGRCNYSLWEGYTFTQRAPSSLMASYYDERQRKLFTTSTPILFRSWSIVRIDNNYYDLETMTGYSSGDAMYAEHKLDVIEGELSGLYHNGQHVTNYAIGPAQHIKYKVEGTSMTVVFTTSPRNVVIEGKETGDSEFSVITTIIIDGTNEAALFAAGII